MKKFNDWDWRIKILGPIFYSLAISSLFIYDFLLTGSSTKIIALILIITGYTLMLAARFQLKDKFSITPRAKGLVTTGLYSIFRHPVYLFSSLSAIGIGIYLLEVFDNNLLKILDCLFSVFYISMQLNRAKKEELKMTKKFGQSYLDYKKRTI